MAETQATTQLYHDSEEMAADSSKSSKLLLYQSAFFHLRLMLEAEVGTVSTVAFQEGLIELELYTAVVEQKMYVTSQSQMMLLLTTLCKKMKDHPAEAKGIVEKFLQIMESEAAYDHLRMRLRKCLKSTFLYKLFYPLFHDTGMLFTLYCICVLMVLKRIQFLSFR